MYIFMGTFITSVANLTKVTMLLLLVFIYMELPGNFHDIAFYLSLSVCLLSHIHWFVIHHNKCAVVVYVEYRKFIFVMFFLYYRMLFSSLSNNVTVISHSKFDPIHTKTTQLLFTASFFCLCISVLFVCMYNVQCTMWNV